MPENKNLESKKTVKYKIHGMHCSSCEVLIERKWKNIDGVHNVCVYQARGYAEVSGANIPEISQLNNAIKEHGYKVAYWNDHDTSKNATHNTKRDYFEIGAIFLVILGVYLLFRQFNFLPDLGISDNMGIGIIFAIGLIAAFSTCMAVTGGLLLAVAAKYNESNPHISGYKKFRPHVYFNIGRMVSYTVLGGILGAVGSIFTLSPASTGLLSIAASVIMVLLGIQLLKLFPRLGRFQPKMPKFIQHKIHDLSASQKPYAPFLLGAFTFFLPCGFTQGLQLYVLSRGDMMTGAVTMFVFSLGTLPALLALSAISSFAKGKFQRYFLKFAGVLVLLLGLWNIQNGLNLIGVSVSFAGEKTVDSNTQVIDPNVKIENGRQIVEMKVDYIDYVPYHFTVYKDIPVEWRIDGKGATGCTQVITVPKLGITEYLPRDGVKIITFTPRETGEIKFSCSMGMTDSRARFTVIENPNQNLKDSLPSSAPAPSIACNPDITDCLSAQKLNMEISRERGFYPNIFSVKKNIPVELEIDTKVPMGGCMGVLVIPQYKVAHRLVLGKSTLKFTPTRDGIIPFTCSMGSKLGEFNVSS